MKKFLALFVAFVALLSGPAMAQTASTTTTSQTMRDIVFSEVEKRVIRDYFGVERTTAAKEEDDNKEGDRDDDDDDDRGKGKKDKKHKDKGKKSKGMPPGLAKKKQLPPGLQKHLEKHGSLPPGLAKRDLPSDLKYKLPEEAAGTERQVVGNDVVLIEQGTGIVLDILRDVITKGTK